MTASVKDSHVVDTVVLDIDGVLVLETSAGSTAGEEIIVLHEGLESRLEDLNVEVVFLTHRSRPEAGAILGAAGLGPRWLRRCLCANDIFASAVSSGQWLRLARHGMRKSLALPCLRKRFGVDPQNCLFIDDRIDNVIDMCGRGIGLGAVAPSAVDPAGVVTTFDFDEIAAIVNAPRARPAGELCEFPVLRLHPRKILVASHNRTGLVTRQAAWNGFNLARRVASVVRRGFRSRS